MFIFFFFFFSSRRRHTRCGRDWSSDVCSSDLTAEVLREEVACPGTRHPMPRVTAGRRIGAVSVPASASSWTRYPTKPGGSGGNPGSITPSLEQRQHCPGPPPTNGSPGCWSTSEHRRQLRRVVESQYTLPLRCWRWR